MARPVRRETGNDGAVPVSFPDIPEALTEGTTDAEALAEARDCRIAALDGYVDGRRDIPTLSPARDRRPVAFPALVAVKIALYRAMRGRGLSNAALARRLGTVEGTVRRLVDPDHRWHIDQVETALRALGQRWVVVTRAA
ncbi:MAG: type II toxin-antitoxin system HicB family antitoxin [Defluviicoccus sp.]|nr:type II toxin-antitoxin system HicB family antitoxin [Defluviicoccus sp.]